MEYTIHTKHLKLRPFKDEDAFALNKIANQKHVLKWMPDWKMAFEDTKKLIRYFIAQYPLASKSTARVMFAMELSNTIIGMVGIGNKKEVNNEIEIAYFISKDYAGKGYITEAVTAISQWSFSNLKIDYLIAIVETSNYPSQRVIEKCNF